MRTNSKIKSAHAMVNGVVFYSIRHKGYGTLATIDKEGNVHTQWMIQKEISKKDTEMSDYDEKNLMNEVKYLVIGMIFNIFMLKLVSDILYINIILAMQTLCLGYVISTLGIFLLTANYRKKHNYRAYKFRSAKNMVINAYEELKRIPTIEECYRYSPFWNRDKTNLTMAWITRILLLFVCCFIRNFFLFIVAIIASIILVEVLKRRGMLNGLQMFNTVNPEEQELLVAIAGMEEWIKHEEKENT